MIENIKKIEMNQDEIYDLIEGLMAYESGAIDAGIKDDEKKHQLKMYLKMDSAQADLILGRFIRDTCFLDDMMIQDRGIEQAKAIIDWLSYEMGIDY